MGLLDRFKKANEDMLRAQREPEVSALNLAKIEETVKKQAKENKRLKDHFVGKLFRGKLIENIRVILTSDGGVIVKVQYRVISFEEYLTNNYEALVKDDAWISGAFGVYGGTADRKEWVSLLSGILINMDSEDRELHIKVGRSLATIGTDDKVAGFGYKRLDDDRILRKVLTDELGVDEILLYTDIKGIVDKSILEKAYDKVIDFIVQETEGLKGSDKYWYYFGKDGHIEDLVDKIVNVANTAVNEVVKIKEVVKLKELEK